MRLYDIAEALDAVISGGLVYDEETGEVLFDSDNLDELEEALDAKLEGCGIVIKGLEAEAEAIKAEEARLADRRRRKEKEAERLREYVLRCMESVGEKELETPRIRIATRRSTFVDVLDEGSVPRDYVRVTTSEKVDKKAVMKALKAGEDVPGCSISERFSLQLR